MSVFRVHLLDMGGRKYGDCLVCEIGDTRVLIDGGHLGDQNRSDPKYPSIPEQLEEILGQPSPWHFDLLVVTHAHVDHIGCLPNLVSNGRLTADWALVADEALGWGEVEGHDAPVLADAPEPVRQVFALLREERPSFASRAEMEAFAADAVKMRASYTAMLTKLASGGCKVVRHGKDDPAGLLQTFQAAGLEILGPTQEHLLICARQIAVLGRDAADAIATRLEQDDALDIASFFQDRASFAVDSGSFDLGNAINDQSLVLAFQSSGRKILLTGDMQLADPLVPGLEPEMEALRQRIAGAGPFDLVKLPHHGARNAVDPAVLTETGSSLFTISGGHGSSKHPHPNTIKTLKAASDIAWYRTEPDSRGRPGRRGGRRREEAPGPAHLSRPWVVGVMMVRSGREVSTMPSTKKKARILSTGAVQRIVNEEMPGFRVVELEPEPEDMHEVIARKASRSLPSLVKIRQTSRAADAHTQPAQPTTEATEESLWGNSSQFALVEREGPATTSDTMARRRRTVIVSHGKIITEQG